MAIFKILKGDSSRISKDVTPFHDGHAYFTPDDAGFYIDSLDDGVENRIRINPPVEDIPVQDNEPADAEEGDLWIDTSEGSETGNYIPEPETAAEGQILTYTNGEWVAADAPEGGITDVSEQIATHNTATDAHGDIRTAKQDKAIPVEVADKIWFEGDTPAEPTVEDAFEETAENLYKKNYAFNTEPTVVGTPDFMELVAYGDGMFLGMAVRFGCPITSTDGVNWTLHSDAIVPIDIYRSRLKYIGDSFVLYTDGEALRSTDGITWKNVGGIWARLMYFTDIAYGNGTTVILGGIPDAEWRNDYDGILYSTDGTNWTQVYWEEGTHKVFTALAYGGGKFVCVGKDDRTLYSTDGINWTETTIPESAGNWTQVIYADGKFVAIGNSSYIATSIDGVTWELSAAPNSALKSIAFGNGFFVATAGSGYAGYSTDCINWTQLSSDAHYGVAFGDGKFVCRNISENSISISFWETVVVSTENAYGFAYKSELRQENEVASVTVASVAGTDFSCVIANSLSSITYGGGRFVATGHGEPTCYSDDGENWTQATGIDNSTEKMLAYGNGRFVAVRLDDAGGVAYYSEDGAAWIAGTTSLPNASTVGFGFDKFWLFTQEKEIYYSADGSTWTKSGDTYHPIAFVVNAGDRVLAYSPDNDQLVYTVDGETWTTAIPNFEPYCVPAYSNGLFLGIDYSDVCRVWASTDGVIWNKRGTLPDARVWSLYSKNGVFVAVSLTGQVLASSDGFDWTEVIALPSGYYDFSNPDAWGDEKWVLGRNYAPEAVVLDIAAEVKDVTTNAYSFAYTTDVAKTASELREGISAVEENLREGISAVEENLHETVLSANFASAAVNFIYPGTCGFAFDRFFVSEGDIGENLYQSEDGLVWERVETPSVRDMYYQAYGNGRLIVSTGFGYLLYTDDGVNWSQTPEIQFNSLCRLFFSAGNFVAWDPRSFALYKSTDGISWSEIATINSILGDRVTDVYCSRDKFFVSGNNRYGEPKYFFSLDLETWTDYTPDATYPDVKFTYGNGKYVGFPTDSTNVVLSSTDGIHWEQVGTLAEIKTISDICFDDGVFSALTSEGSVLLSVDGESWNVAGILDGFTPRRPTICQANGRVVVVPNIETSEIFYVVEIIKNTTNDYGFAYQDEVSAQIDKKIAAALTGIAMAEEVSF